jgi:hypothetical protein
MKFREQLTQPGLIIDLFTIATILSIPIVFFVLLIETLPHANYHRQLDWRHNVEHTAISIACYLAIFFVYRLWKNRKSCHLAAN